MFPDVTLSNWIRPKRQARTGLPGKALGKDLGWCSASPCQGITTVSLAARPTNIGSRTESQEGLLLTWGRGPGQLKAEVHCLLSPIGASSKTVLPRVAKCTSGSSSRYLIHNPPHEKSGKRRWGTPCLVSVKLAACGLRPWDS